MNLTEILLKWYVANARELPWRSTRNPYHIWVSEVILQQTRVAQGEGYYHRFLERFPDVESLAVAEEQDVLKVWEGLGYYSRARNMHHAAQQMLVEGGAFPGTYDALLRLKGIGPYTAAAVASIAFGEPVPLIDGNVARVMARLFCMEEPIDTDAFRRRTLGMLRDLMQGFDPATFNQALMEFGALMCVPGKPDCGSCPLRLHCMAREAAKVELLPIKQKKGQGRTRHFHYFFLRMNIDGSGYTLLHKRTARDIWQHLFEFPMIETAKAIEVEELRQLLWNSDIPMAKKFSLQGSPVQLRHILSHQTIEASFHTIDIDLGAIPTIEKQYTLIPMGRIDEVPLSRLMGRFLEKISR